MQMHVVSGAAAATARACRRPSIQRTLSLFSIGGGFAAFPLLGLRQVRFVFTRPRLAPGGPHRRAVQGECMKQVKENTPSRGVGKRTRTGDLQVGTCQIEFGGVLHQERDGLRSDSLEGLVNVRLKTFSKVTLSLSKNR